MWTLFCFAGLHRKTWKQWKKHANIANTTNAWSTLLSVVLKRMMNKHQWKVDQLKTENDAKNLTTTEKKHGKTHMEQPTHWETPRGTRWKMFTNNWRDRVRKTSQLTKWRHRGCEVETNQRRKIKNQQRIKWVKNTTKNGKHATHIPQICGKIQQKTDST